MSSHLKAFRQKEGLSQGQLGVRLGISKSLVSMIENGRRELPGEARRKLEALRQESQAKTSTPGITAGHSFRELKDNHMREAEEYLLNYKKDCEFTLHKYQKQVRQWTKQYEKAVAQLYAAEQMILNLEKLSPRNENIILQYANERVEATEVLSAISEQKPEIIMIKIAGLKQELRSIKAMLGKQRRYLGMKEIIVSLPAQIPDIENAVPKKELPKNE